MNMQSRALIGFIGILWLFVTPVFAQESAVPQLINYQGKLSTTGGQPLLPTGDYTLSFSIYDKPMATPCSAKTESESECARLIWGPQVFDGKSGMGHGAQVSVVKGFFNVILGPYDINGKPIALAFTASNRFLAVTVNNGKPILPRQQVLGVPYALTSAGNVPIGGITMFFGNQDELPANWKICNGQQVEDPESPFNGTSLPNLQGLFVRGAESKEQVSTRAGLDYRERHKHANHHGHSVQGEVKMDRESIDEYVTRPMLCIDEGNNGTCEPGAGIHFRPLTSNTIGYRDRYRAIVLDMRNKEDSHSHMAEVTGEAHPTDLRTEWDSPDTDLSKLDNRPRHVNLHYIMRIK